MLSQIQESLDPQLELERSKYFEAVTQLLYMSWLEAVSSRRFLNTELPLEQCLQLGKVSQNSMVSRRSHLISVHPARQAQLMKEKHYLSMFVYILVLESLSYSLEVLLDCRRHG